MDEMMEMIKSEIGESKIEENKAKIIELLCSTGLVGMDNLIDHMDKNGFFTAPCSTQYHLARKGGLAEHSLNVYNIMWYQAATLGLLDYRNEADNESFDHFRYSRIIIVSLLHDLGKMGHHGKPNYVENVLKSGKVAAKPFATNSKLLYVPHEIESIAIASRFIELSEEEEFAILMHNGMYSELKYSYSGKETPLSMLLHFSDLWASRVIEKEEE